MKISIKVVPNSKKDAVAEGEPFIVKVTEQAQDGKANRAAMVLLSKHFNAKVKLISGHKSRKKIVEIG